MTCVHTFKVACVVSVVLIRVPHIKSRDAARCCCHLGDHFKLSVHLPGTLGLHTCPAAALHAHAHLCWLSCTWGCELQIVLVVVNIHALWGQRCEDNLAFVSGSSWEQTARGQ